MKGTVEGWYGSGKLRLWILAILIKLVIEGGAAIIVALCISLVAVFAISHLPIEAQNLDVVSVLTLGAALTLIWDSFIEKPDS